MPIRKSCRLTTVFALTLVVLFLLGCGQKGELYLPAAAVAENADF
jgi:predicted small lipoprotein YifL